MKKVISFLFFLGLNLCLFAEQPISIWSDGHIVYQSTTSVIDSISLVSHQEPMDPSYPVINPKEGKIIVVLYAKDASFCNDLVWAGDFNNWNTTPSVLPRFELIDKKKYKNWYMAEFDAPAQAIGEDYWTSGKPNALDVDGTFSQNWSYQWYYGCKVLYGPAYTDFEYGDETKLFIQEPNSVVYIATTGWKNNPCDKDDTKANPERLFDLSDVSEITITVADSAWNVLLWNYDQWPGNSLYVPCQVDYTKQGTLNHRDSVGLRLRGNTSRRRPEGDGGSYGSPHQQNAQLHHVHFGLKFTEYESGERFFGSDRVILKYFKEDPTYAREIFCYDLFRRFGVWTAPKASYCRLTVKIEGDTQPVYMGVYELLENPRKGWLKDRKDRGLIPDNDGNLWKAGYGATLSEVDSSASKMGISDDYGYYTPVYDLKLNKDSLSKAKAELCDFIAGLSSLTPGSIEAQQWLEEHVDVDLFLRAYAVNVMVGMWDDYWSNQNNFYFYFDLNHKFYFIPFDYDNTLGSGSASFADPGTKDMLRWGPYNTSRLLIYQILSVDEYSNRYKNYIKELATNPDLMAPVQSIQRIRDFQHLVENYIVNDTGEDMYIRDRTCSWGNYGGYRLLDGKISGDATWENVNYFYQKRGSINF